MVASAAQTAGHAMEVPLIDAYGGAVDFLDLSGTVDMMPTPGPEQAIWGPTLLNAAEKIPLAPKRSICCGTARESMLPLGNVPSNPTAETATEPGYAAG